jgi:type III restriction enzyme
MPENSKNAWGYSMGVLLIRLFVTEYEGGHLLTNEDTKEKDNVGKLWASKSGNVFLLASVDLNGKDFFYQINEAIA